MGAPAPVGLRDFSQPRRSRPLARTLTPEYIDVYLRGTGVPFAVAIHLPCQREAGVVWIGEENNTHLPSELPHVFRS